MLLWNQVESFDPNSEKAKKAAPLKAAAKKKKEIEKQKPQLDPLPTSLRFCQSSRITLKERLLLSNLVKETQSRNISYPRHHKRPSRNYAGYICQTA